MEETVAEMDPTVARAAAEDALDKMKLSTEETERLGKAFKDPEFMKMFQEYVDEIKDPKYREETEQYLREIEARGEAASMYGDGVELITPEAGFVVKTKITSIPLRDAKDCSEDANKTSSKVNMKVFINICHNSKVQVASSSKIDGGHNWSIPYSLGVSRDGKDKSGAPCEEYDFVINSETYSQCMNDMRFKGLVVDTALEAVESRAGGISLSRDFSFPKLKYKGDTKEPSVQAWRNKSRQSHDATTAESADKREKNDSRTTNPSKTDVSENRKPNKSSAFDIKFDKAEEKSHFSRLCKLETSVDNGDGNTYYEPLYEFVYQHTRNDLGDAWQNGNSEKQLDDDNNRKPTALVIKINLPRLETIANVDLDVTRTKIMLSCGQTYRLVAPFPFPVDESKGRAKFDRDIRLLTVTVPVIIEKKVKPFVEPITREEIEDGAPQLEGCDDNKSHEDGECDNESQTDSSNDVLQETASFEMDVSKEESEAERMWRELHERADAENNKLNKCAVSEAMLEESDSHEQHKSPDSSTPNSCEDDVSSCRNITREESISNEQDKVVEGYEKKEDEDEEEEEEEEEVPVVVRKSAPRLAPRFQISSAIELE